VAARPATERSGAERSGADRSGAERSGAEGRGRAGRRGRGGRPAPDRPAATPLIRARRRRLVVAVLTVLVLGGLLAVTLASPWLDVTRVDVSGAAPETRAAVEQAASIAPDTSLLWLDGDLTGSGVAERVQALPRVASVDVGRDWPHTLTVTVTEREPVLAVPGAGAAGVALVDATGFAYRTIAVAPRGLPVLRLPAGAAPVPGDASTVAAVRVLGALPPDLRRRVTEVRANGAFDVELTLGGDTTVRWGGDTENARKAAVLRALLTRPGSVYDVSSPDLAVVR
jgi:cell division protein FtsQ